MNYQVPSRSVSHFGLGLLNLATSTAFSIIRQIRDVRDLAGQFFTGNIDVFTKKFKIQWYNNFAMESKNLPAPSSEFESQPSAEELRQRRQMIVGIVVGVVLILALLITSLVFLLSPGLTTAETVARIRDVFIIVMAFESLMIGFVMVILIVQIARLTNLLQNEIKPILDSTNETISTLRGTTNFLSDNLVGPVIKLNEYIAGLQKMVEMLGFGRKRPS